MSRRAPRREFVIHIMAVPGSPRPPIYWTGSGWTVSRPDAIRMGTEMAEQLLKIMLEDRMLRSTEPSYRLTSGARIETEAW